MKRHLLIIVPTLMSALFLSSCGSENGAPDEHDHGAHAPKKAAIVYACPMKCEKTKTYAEPGKCPKCGMALKTPKAAHAGHGHGDEHAEGGHGEHAEGGHSHESEIKIPADAKDIWAEINGRVSLLDKTISAGKLSEVHKIAFEIRDLADALPAASGTIVAESKHPSLQQYVSRVGKHAENLDKYGDAGNAAKTRTRHYAQLTTTRNRM